MKKRNLVGPRVLEERKRRGLTQKVVVTTLKNYGVRMSPRTLSLLERQRRPAYDKEIYALSKMLNVSLDRLLDRE